MQVKLFPTFKRASAYARQMEEALYCEVNEPAPGQFEVRSWTYQELARQNAAADALGYDIGQDY